MLTKGTTDGNSFAMCLCPVRHVLGALLLLWLVLKICTGNWVKICPQNSPKVQFDTALTQSTRNRKIANNRRQILRWKVSTGRIPKLICLLFAGINVAAVVVPLVLLVLSAVLLAAGFFYYKRQVDQLKSVDTCSLLHSRF